MIRVDRASCCYCGTCVAVCPEMALELIDACLIVKESCRCCGMCTRICPAGALEDLP